MRVDGLAAASAALNEGRPEDALQHLEGLEGPDADLLSGWAHLDIGHLKGAEEHLARAALYLSSDDLDLRWLRAEVDLRAWRIEGAREGFEFLLDLAREPAFLERLALCLELDQDWDGAQALLVEAAEIDPDASPLPARLSETEFDEVVAAAVAELPVTFSEALTRCRLVTEPMPFLALVPAGAPEQVPPDLFGLFTGPDIHELAEDQTGTLPPTIYLFQRNLERASAEPQTLREEVRVTLYHELGHLLGLDEEEVDSLGLG